MNNLLEIRIRQVYPTGLLWEFDENQLGKNDQAARIELALSSVTKTASLRVVLDPGNDPLYALAITHTDDPAFGEWIWTMRNPDKTAWCKTNNRPYVVFWLRISRVADYFRFFYNHWRPRGDTGYMDADTQSSSPPCASRRRTLRATRFIARLPTVRRCSTTTGIPQDQISLDTGPTNMVTSGWAYNVWRCPLGHKLLTKDAMHFFIR